MSAEEVVTESGAVVPQLRLTRDLVLRRSVAVYGPSGSGKTVVTKHILDLLRGYVDSCIVISPTECSNHSFQAYVPAPLIHYDMTAADPKNPNKRIAGVAGVERFLESIWKRQEFITSLYESVNLPSTLKLLFQRIDEKYQEQARKDLDRISAMETRMKNQVRKKFRAEPDTMMPSLQKVKKRFEEIRTKLFKKYIRKDFLKLWNNPRLSEIERRALHYVDIKPGLVLIFDDCASDLSLIVNKPIFKKLFYQNRHNHITVISTYQDDTDLKPNLRKNAFLSIFCTQVVASTFFNRTGGGGYPKDVKEQVRDCAPAIFAREYRTLAYLRDDPQRQVFYHFTAPAPLERPFCSPAVQELCETMKAPAGDLDKNNPYYDAFDLPSI